MDHLTAFTRQSVCLLSCVSSLLGRSPQVPEHVGPRRGPFLAATSRGERKYVTAYSRIPPFCPCVSVHTAGTHGHRMQPASSDHLDHARGGSAFLASQYKMNNKKEEQGGGWQPAQSGYTVLPGHLCGGGIVGQHTIFCQHHSPEKATRLWHGRQSRLWTLFGTHATTTKVSRALGSAE